MKPTPYNVFVGGQVRRVRMDAAGRLTVKVKASFAPRVVTNRFGTRTLGGGTSVTVFRARTFWQLQRQIRGSV